MKHLTRIAIILAVAGCSPRDVDQVTEAWELTDVAGSYGQSGHIGHLELDATGTYECFVVNGITVGGCATFRGAGMSKGRWTLEGGSVSFDPISEPSDLVVTLSGASAVRADNGLVLTVGGTDHLLVRKIPLAEQPNQAIEADDPSARR